MGALTWPQCGWHRTGGSSRGVPASPVGGVCVRISCYCCRSPRHVCRSFVCIVCMRFIKWTSPTRFCNFVQRVGLHSCFVCFCICLFLLFVGCFVISSNCLVIGSFVVFSFILRFHAQRPCVRIVWAYGFGSIPPRHSNFDVESLHDVCSRVGVVAAGVPNVDVVDLVADLAVSVGAAAPPQNMYGARSPRLCWCRCSRGFRCACRCIGRRRGIAPEVVRRTFFTSVLVPM